MNKNPMTKKISSHFGTLTHFYRKQRRITLVTLSKETGISASFLSRVERGKNTPVLADVVLIANYFGFSLNELQKPFK